MGRPLRCDRADRTPVGPVSLKKETDVERHLQDRWGGRSPPEAGVLDGDIPFGGDWAARATGSAQVKPSATDCNWLHPGTSSRTAYQL